LRNSALVIFEVTINY